MKRGQKGIDAQRAAELYASGRWTWREVGILLADEEGRRVAYQPKSVIGAVRKMDRAPPT